ncbi:MAG TPA: oxygenase MpaB family protein [Ferruginibacter sp.]|nr:oxygenase MpaB family protein [Ferruginibacter sp.]
MEYFVEKNSIVRKIWGEPDCVMLIFAGAAAEFALNKAVDWLYFTGNLPKDPIGRLFSTVSYAGKIIYSEKKDALKTIDAITSIHAGVENKRGSSIPEWAYRDVLYMLIHYSIASYEALAHKLSAAEKQEVYDVFYRLGERMKLKDLPLNYQEWLIDREFHLVHDLVKSGYSLDLFKQYKKHLGSFRYLILLEGQILVAPSKVRQLLHLRSFSLLKPLLPLYKLSRAMKLDGRIKSMMLPGKYKHEIDKISFEKKG